MDHFHRVSDGSKVSSQCKKCLHIMSNKMDRMTTRYKKCSQQTTLQSSDGQSEPTPVPDASPSSVGSSTSQPQKRSLADPFGPAPPAKKRQSDLNNHIVRTSQATKEELDEKVKLVCLWLQHTLWCG
jgi:hypothetical protein